MVEERFWAKVEKRGPDECWPWTASCFPTGYGQFKAYGHKIGAHRMVWQIANGPIPDGLWVLHKCDNPPCVNPAHLWLGTHADNQADKVAKSRWDNPMSMRTHCPQGHPYSGENLLQSFAARHCRACARDASRRYRERHPEKVREINARYRAKKAAR